MGTLTTGQKIQTLAVEPVIIEGPVEVIVEKVVEVIVEKVVEKEVTVEVIVEKIVEKIVEVPVEVVKEVIKEVPKVVYVDKIIKVEDSSKIDELSNEIKYLKSVPPAILTPKWVYPVILGLGILMGLIILIK